MTIYSILDSIGTLPFEYILLDDGSSDNSLQMAHIAISTYPEAIRSRVRIMINPENKGLTYCGNKVLDISRGKFILRVDADDTVNPEFINRVMSVCNGTSAITTGYNRAGKDHQEKHYHSGCSLLNTRIAQELRYKYNLPFAKGTAFLEAFEKFHKIMHLPDVLWQYNQRKGSLTDQGVK